MSDSLLTRDEFREGVFARDSHACVICKGPACDAHHILERRLFHDGGYYLDNGASLCGKHHLDAERTVLSVEDIRISAGITKPVLPEHLYSDQPYTKWGDPILPNNMRGKGELFFDESVQKILKEGGVLSLYTDYIKYPRTYHFPWSCNITDDDRTLTDFSHLQNEETVVTVKMDGENTTLYHDYIHARSLDSPNHASRNWVKNFWGSIRHDIPAGYRICGENLFAKHSIGYDSLKSYFYGFSMWNDRNECLSWDETMEWFQLLNIVPVEVLYRGIYDAGVLGSIVHHMDFSVQEGYVARITKQFPYAKFKKCAAKYVRKDHVMTTKHWMRGQPIERNKLA